MYINKKKEGKIKVNKNLKNKNKNDNKINKKIKKNTRKKARCIKMGGLIYALAKLGIYQSGYARRLMTAREGSNFVRDCFWKKKKKKKNEKKNKKKLRGVDKILN